MFDRSRRAAAACAVSLRSFSTCAFSRVTAAFSAVRAVVTASIAALERAASWASLALAAATSLLAAVSWRCSFAAWATCALTCSGVSGSRSVGGAGSPAVGAAVAEVGSVTVAACAGAARPTGPSMATATARRAPRDTRPRRTLMLCPTLAGPGSKILRRGDPAPVVSMDCSMVSAPSPTRAPIVGSGRSSLTLRSTLPIRRAAANSDRCSSNSFVSPPDCVHQRDCPAPRPLR